MDFEIVPYRSVGDIIFGDSRVIIKRKLSSLSYRTLRRFANANDEDVFDDSIFIEYNNNDYCDAITIANEKQHNLYFMGTNLLRLTYAQIFHFFKRIKANINEDDSGFTSLEYGIGIYAPDKDENINCLIEAIIVFRKGYYE